MFAYIWEDVVNVDHTGGDVLIVARDLQQAYALWDKRMALPTHQDDFCGGVKDAFKNEERMVGDAALEWGYPFDPRKKEPDRVIPLDRGLVYCGPGGG